MRGNRLRRAPYAHKWYTDPTLNQIAIGAGQGWTVSITRLATQVGVSICPKKIGDPQPIWVTLPHWDVVI